MNNLQVRCVFERMASTPINEEDILRSVVNENHLQVQTTKAGLITMPFDLSLYV